MTNLLLALIALSVLLLFLVIENILSRKRRKRLKIAIQVNGTRGKSETVRLIHSALKANGFSVLGKTTGTVPIWITPDGRHVEVVRHGPANIQEQFLALKKSERDGCNALVVECMAIKPEMQLSSMRIVEADITVITNSYPDHIEEIGADEIETAKVLSLSITPGGICVLGNVSSEAMESVKNHCSRINTRLVTVTPKVEDTAGFRFEPNEENLSIALKVVELLDLDREKALEGMREALPDVGTFRYLHLGDGIKDTVLANAFAANDIRSTSLLLEKARHDFPERPLVGFFNSRDDRPDRALVFEAMIREFDRIIVRGPVPQRILKSKNVEKLKDPSRLYSLLQGHELVFGFGNIRGLVQWLSGLEEIR